MTNKESGLKYFGDLIIANSKEDIYNSGMYDKDWERFDHAVIYPEDVEYPAMFKYEDSMDSHCCGSWDYIEEESERREIVNSKIGEYSDTIDALSKKIEELTSLLS